MAIRFHKYGVVLAFLVLTASAGCESDRDASTAPTSFSSSLATPSSLGFEPGTLVPEVLLGAPCAGAPPFGTRIIIIVNGGHGVLSGLRFSFTDRFGVHRLPRVTPIPGDSPLSVAASAIPSSFPIPVPGIAPLPSTSPIPMPSPGSSQRLPFFLGFDCGVAPEGMLFIGADVADTRGMIKTSELRVRVGR